MCYNPTHTTHVLIICKGEIHMSNNLIVGLDIGTTKIAAVVGEQTHDGINIIGIGNAETKGLREGVVVNIESTVQSIKKALEEAELMAGCQIRSIYAGIAGKHVQGINSHGVIAITGREVTLKDMDRAIDAARAVAIPLDREVIHVIPQAYLVDDQHGISDPLGMSGVRLEVKVHIVTGASSSIQNIIRSCDKSGLAVSEIVLESLASAQSILTEEEKELGVALVDIGGGTSDIIVYLDNALCYTGIVPIAGQYISSDIAFALRTAPQAAEYIKIHDGCAMKMLVQEEELIEVPSVGGRESRNVSKAMVAKVCEARVEEILRKVDKELIRSECKGRLGAGVVLTGGTSLMYGLPELASKIFDLPVRVGYPRGIGGLKDVVNNPRYATAVGLLQYASMQEKKSDWNTTHSTKGSIFSKMIDNVKRWISDVS